MPKKNKSKQPPKQVSLSRIEEQVNKFLIENFTKSFNYKQIAKAISAKSTQAKQGVLHALKKLTAQKLLKEVETGKYQTLHPPKIVVGQIEMTAYGNAYLVVQDQKEDVFVHRKNLKTALNKDTVKAIVFQRGKRLEAKVTDIVKRYTTKFVCTIELSKKFAFAIPDNNNINTDIFIPLSHLNNAAHKQKVLVEILEWPQKETDNPVGKVVSILGYAGEHQTEIHAIIAEYGFSPTFDKQVEKAAKNISDKITKSEIKKRKDFRQITTFTIDPFDAKDFDDALSIQFLPNGNYEIGVHIADVSHYVLPETVIDQEAYQRGTSVYLVDRVIPMLPERLSNFICSLRPNEDKLTFSAVFEMDKKANVINQWFGKTIICSKRRFTYEEVQTIIETQQGEYLNEILTLDQLAKQLRQQRLKQGGIEFEKIEVKFNLDQTGKPIGIYFKESKDAHKLIEDFMLLANKRVAEFASKKLKNKFVYRVHDLPNEEKLLNLSNFVKNFGYNVQFEDNKKVKKSLNNLLHNVKGKPEANVIEQIAIRAMAKAVYTTKNIGHYGLNFDAYTHFTSPIRRYPDLMVHRLLQDILTENYPQSHFANLEEKCQHASEMERRATEAERASIKYKQVEFMKAHVGEVFDGIVSGVTEFGLFVEIIDNKCEGLVRIRDIDDDVYVFDEKSYCLKGMHHKKKYVLGEQVRVLIARADLVKKQLDFKLVS